jgi:hypothetical protein
LRENVSRAIAPQSTGIEKAYVFTTSDTGFAGAVLLVQDVQPIQWSITKVPPRHSEPTEGVFVLKHEIVFSHTAFTVDDVTVHADFWERGRETEKDIPPFKVGEEFGFRENKCQSSGIPEGESHRVTLTCRLAEWQDGNDLPDDVDRVYLQISAPGISSFAYSSLRRKNK